jgi:hypothetical protein
MSIHATRARLLKLTDQIAKEWAIAMQAWRDEKSVSFEHRYLENLFSDARAAASVQEKLEKLISKVKKDCE